MTGDAGEGPDVTLRAAIARELHRLDCEDPWDGRDIAQAPAAEMWASGGCDRAFWLRRAYAILALPEWQDMNRTYTTGERSLDSRLDCEPDELRVGRMSRETAQKFVERAVMYSLIDAYHIRAHAARQEAKEMLAALAGRTPGELRAINSEPYHRAEYWCGCVRDIRFERCYRHLSLDFDQEPPAQDRASHAPAPWRSDLTDEQVMEQMRENWAASAPATPAGPETGVLLTGCVIQTRDAPKPLSVINGKVTLERYLIVPLEMPESEILEILRRAIGLPTPAGDTQPAVPLSVHEAAVEVFEYSHGFAPRSESHNDQRYLQRVEQIISRVAVPQQSDSAFTFSDVLILRSQLQSGGPVDFALLDRFIATLRNPPPVQPSGATVEP